MEPKLIAHPFDSPDHLFQVKWDGVRCLSYLEPPGITLINKRLNHRTAQYPELVAALTQLKNQEVILDGEIIAFDSSGKPNFRRVLKRDLVKSGDKATRLVHQVPVNYLVFDILYYQGKNICHLSLTTRQELLATVLSPLAPGELIQRVDNFPGEGRTLYQTVEREGLEGIVAKHMGSPYLLGEKSPYWHKIKCWRQLKAVVCGLLVKNRSLRSLLLAAYEEDRLVYIGNLASGLTQEHRKLLLAYSKNSGSNSSPSLTNPPKRLAGEIIWTAPELVVLVKYLEWTSDLKLRSPFLVDFLPEPPESCQLN
jgi:bifunctional non-homologous end joining protein LigD